VGANIGVYSVIAARVVGPAGKVLAFEPEPNSRARLEQNVELNALNNVEAVPVALSAHEGTFSMVRGRAASSGNHRLQQQDETAPQDQTIQVQAMRGDAFRDARQLPAPTLIKIDVEGAELDVFEGLQQTLKDPGCRSVICEVHFSILQAKGQGDAPMRITKLLDECGFERITWIDRSHLAAFKSHD
jgi:FkbM family methyltransferase